MVPIAFPLDWATSENTEWLRHSQLIFFWVCDEGETKEEEKILVKNVLMVLKPVASHLKALIPKAPSILTTEPLVCGSHCGPSTRPGVERGLHLSEEGVFFSCLN